MNYRMYDLIQNNEGRVIVGREMIRGLDETRLYIDSGLKVGKGHIIPFSMFLYMFEIVCNKNLKSSV